ncbi:hypothetical protein NIES2119_09880 [[Phormidium ambiguum] IAM M-71]|uniref:Virulence-associated protein E-like domain-containing protein n=1 Tax=[Phormidium ambiguum] IAM M-71 TaxID=454136 RepID=A0A1U7IM20_9CYAN|nr:VapE domain-containing protein [Phormidium ambiguum]OKH38336.1 hypothetical protein NIES2119_09880 [Phormidium ambiguum IAM M-71]
MLNHVSKTNPCPHCGKPDWCYSLNDLTVCKRDAEPAQGWYKTTKTDSDGSFYYAPEQPKKKVRPKGTRYWVYLETFTKKPLVRVCRTDDGEGGKPNRWQERWNEKTKKWVKGLTGISRDEISVYRYHEIRQAIKDKQPIFIVEGEPCADALWDLGLAATTNIGGSGKWTETDTDDLAGAEQIILCPDRDKPGLKHMEEIAENFPAAKWLYAYPDSPFWEPGRIAESKGLDVADWIGDFNLKADDILKAVEPKRKFAQPKIKTENESDEEDKEQKFNSKTNAKLHFIRNKIGNKLSYNLLKKYIEYNRNPLVDELDDQGGAKLFIAEELDIDVSDGDGLAILNKIAKENSYHPVLDYLESCYQKYGTDNSILDNFAFRYFGSSDPLHQTYITKHLIASCKRAFEPGCKYDTILILQGKTGLRKSTFFKVLHGEEFFTDSVTGTEEKDSLMILARYWCCEYGEFEAITRKKEKEELKRFLSRDTDDYRAPYARVCKPHPRSFVFAGTANRDDFLQDETGSRRYMPIPVGVYTIPIETLRAERDRIWGAAMALYRAGVSCELSREEMEIQKVLNEDFSQVDPWQDAISAYVEERKSEFIPTTQILEKAIGLDVAQMDVMANRRANAVMMILGWKRCRRRIQSGSIPWGWVWPDPQEDIKIAEDLEQAVERIQQEVQQAAPVVPQEDTVETCVGWVKAVVADNDTETAGHIKVVLQDICAEKPEFRGAIWENLDAKEREVFRQLTTPKIDDSAESESANYENEMLAKDMEKALAKGLKIGDRVRYTLENLVTEGELISDVYPGKGEPLAHAKIKYDDGTELVVQVRFLEKIDAIAQQTIAEEKAIAHPPYKVGDSIIINKKHKVSAGKHYVIAEVQENGWVQCEQGTVGALFHEEFFNVLIPEKTILKALKHKDHDFWNKSTLNQGKLEAVIRKDGKYWARVTCKRSIEMFNLEAVEVIG